MVKIYHMDQDFLRNSQELLWLGIALLSSLPSVLAYTALLLRRTVSKDRAFGIQSVVLGHCLST